MARTNRIYVLAAFFFSAVASVFNIISLGTEQWVHSALVSDGSNSEQNTVNYGLFQGNYKRMPFSIVYQITMTCNFKNNVCALLCGTDADERYTLLNNLYNNNIDPKYGYENCPRVYRSPDFLNFFQDKALRADSNNSVSEDSFINAGVWLCTLIFLILALLFGLFASILALYNTVTNPILYLLSVRSLFFYNGAAFCFTLMYMILWGVMYSITILHNVGLYDTLVGSIDSNKQAFLGYSYWISFISLVFYCASIAILYYREYLNARDPRQQKVDLDVDSANPNLYLY